MSNICDFDRILNATCYSEIAELRIWMTLKETRKTSICRQHDF